MWKEEEYGHGKCINCGYLGKKDTLGLGQECYIANAEERTTGTLSHHIIITRMSLDTVPWCFVGKADLNNEVDQLDSQIDRTARTLSIITQDRNCPSWYVWREFSSPKEQWEESVMLAMEKRREDFEKRIEQDRQDFELKLEETIRQERNGTNRIMIGLTIAAIIFAAMQVYVALALINPEHWLFNWLR